MVLSKRADRTNGCDEIRITIIKGNIELDRRTGGRSADNVPFEIQTMLSIGRKIPPNKQVVQRSNFLRAEKKGEHFGGQR